MEPGLKGRQVGIVAPRCPEEAYLKKSVACEGMSRWEAEGRPVQRRKSSAEA